MRQEIAIASICVLVGTSGATGQSLPIFLSAPAVPNGCDGLGLTPALPGLESCIRIGGYVWAGATLTRTVPSLGPASPADRIIGTGGVARSSQDLQARLSIDSRTDTPYGPFRAYVSVRAR